MLDKFKKIIKIFLGYGLSQFIVILIPVILVPILTNKLQINEFADYSLYKSLHGLFIPLIGFAIPTYLLKYYYIDLKNEVNKFLFTSIVYSSLISILLIILSYFFIDFINSFLSLKNIETLFYVFLNTFLFSIHTLLLTTYRAKSNTNHFLISNCIILITTLGLIFFIDSYSQLNLSIVLFVHSLSYIVSIFIGLIFFIKIHISDFVFDHLKLRDVLFFCFPLFLYSLLAQIYSQADRIIINTMLLKSDLAIYSATFQLAFGVSAMGSVLQLAWNPYIFKVMANDKKINFNIVKKMILLILFILFFSFFYYLILPLIIKLFLPESYLTGDKLFKWFIMGGLCQVIYWIINPFLIIYEKNELFVYITLLSAIISVSLNMVYTKNGVEYAAIIYFLTWIIQLISLIISVAYAKKNYKIL